MSRKVGPYGGDNGNEWDDGVYDGLRKVCVGEDSDRLSYVEFEYVKGDQSITLSHGSKPKELKKFVMEDEYVKSVEGTFNEDGYVSSLTFKTSKGRDSQVFGKEVGTKFSLEAKGFDKLVGFRGMSSHDRLNALGAHFAVVVAHPLEKLEAKGGKIGKEWDDGIHDNVRKITVTYEGHCVYLVRFKYLNDTTIVIGEAHGKISPLPTSKTEKFKLREDEYITSVEGYYGKKLQPLGTTRGVIEVTGGNHITMLKFKTNIATYEVLGHNQDHNYEGTPFTLEKKDHKIVGFHGKSTSSLEKIGVYVKPINNS